MKQSKGGKVCLGSQLKGSWWPTEDGKGQRPIEDGRGVHIVSPVRRQKGASAGAQLIFPFSTAHDPSLVMVLPHSGWVFLFCLTLPQHSPTGMSRGPSPRSF